jgi:predicted nuclease with TOPRIM domain
MNEKLQPINGSEYEQVDQITYINGVDHYYGVDENGTRSHVAADDILEAYGYDFTDSPNATPTQLDVYFTNEQKEIIDTAQENIAITRNELIEANAKSRKTLFGIREGSRKKDVEAAKEKYDQTIAITSALILEAFNEQGGIEAAEIETLSKIAGVAESYKVNVEGLTERQQELADGKFMGRFNDWYTRQTANDDPSKRFTMGKFKKGLATLGIGAAGAVTAAAVLPVGAVVGGAGAAGVVAWRFAKGQSIGRIKKNADARTQADVHNTTVHDETVKRISESSGLVSGSVISEGVVNKTKEYVSKNRKREAISLALGATAGYALEQAGVIGWVSDKVNVGNPFSKINLPFGNPSNNNSEDITGNLDAEGLDDSLEEANRVTVLSENVDELTDKTEELAEQLGELITDNEELLEQVEELTTTNEELSNQVDNLTDTVEEHVDHLPSDPITIEPQPAAPGVVAIKGAENFTVENGAGFVSEIQDLAEANGQHIDSEKAFQIYNDTRAEFGNDLLNIGEYIENGDLRIATPGQASYNPGVAEFMMRRMQELAEAEAEELLLIAEAA